MKKYRLYMKFSVILISFFLSLFFPTSLIAQNNAGKPERIAVFDFETTNLTNDEVRLFTDQISSYISETGKYTVIEREQRDKLIEELKFSLSGYADQKEALELGKMLTARYIVIGNIGNIGTQRFWINVKLINVTTGENEKSISKEYKSLPRLLDDARELIKAFIEPEEYNTGEYIVITPRNFTKFDFLGTGYSSYTQKYESGAKFKASSVPITWIGNRGNKIGIFWDLSYYIPFYTSDYGTELILSNYSFIFGVSGSVGISTIIDITNYTNILLGIGPHLDEHQYWKTKEYGPDPLVMALGLSLPVYIFYRFKTNLYLGIASIFSYDFYMIDLAQKGQLDGMGLDFRLIFGSSK